MYVATLTVTQEQGEGIPDVEKVRVELRSDDPRRLVRAVAAAAEAADLAHRPESQS